MSTATTIEWTDATWNPVTGCDRVSAGCDNCYALTLAKRLKAMGNPRYQNDGRPETSGPGFGVTLHEDKLVEPLTWKKPRRVFVNSMSDLFHASVPRSFVERVWDVMEATPQHTYQILTKRPARMRLLLSDRAATPTEVDEGYELGIVPGIAYDRELPNVWLGVSVEDQEHADKRIPELLRTPTAVRFLSIEPMLGPVRLDRFIGHPRLCPDGKGWESMEAPSSSLHWVIVGGESGANHRPITPDWVRCVRDQCVASGVPFFFKQWGGHTPKAGGRELDGQTWDEYPSVVEGTE